MDAQATRDSALAIGFGNAAKARALYGPAIKLRETRRDIARVKTVLREKQVSR